MYIADTAEVFTNDFSIISNFWSSDESGLRPGLESLPARPIFARPGPPEARSKKPESPGAFFGPKIGRFSTDFRPN